MPPFFGHLGLPRRCGENWRRYLRFTNVVWKARRVDGFSTNAMATGRLGHLCGGSKTDAIFAARSSRYRWDSSVVMSIFSILTASRPGPEK